jgi:hypothetical protein
VAAYPTTGIDISGSVQDPIDDLSVDEWPDGSARGRSYVALGRFKWILVHTFADSDKAILDAFYAANRLAQDISFSSPFDGVNYTGCIFTAKMKQDRLVPNAVWKVTAYLRKL